MGSPTKVLGIRPDFRGPFLTVGYRRNGVRFGDPHAIHYPAIHVNQNSLQVVGFLAFNEENKDSPACKAFERISYVPRGLLG